MDYDLIGQLEAWYRSQCDGEWEHSWGVKIDTLDNPGWEVSIDLVGTDLLGMEFLEVAESEDEVDWICCNVRGNQFQGFGGPNSLHRILKVFLEWSRQTGTASSA